MAKKNGNGSENVNPSVEEVEISAPMGGRRKHGKTAKRKTAKRKLSKGASKWQKFVMETFRKMRAKNKTIKLRDAMKEAARLKKKGQY